MFDLNTLAVEETADMKVRSPIDGEVLIAKDGSEVTIQLYSTSSKKYRNAVTAMQNRQLRRSAKKDKVTVELMREEQVELLVAASAGSKGLAIGDKPVASAEDFRSLYSNPAFGWLMDQVNEALGDVANFIRQ
jgi:hypothetical protein